MTVTAQLLNAEQVRDIEGLIRQIGVDPDSSSVTLAQTHVGGTSAPYGYLLLTRSQALSFIMLMTRYLRERERVGNGDGRGYGHQNASG